MLRWKGTWCERSVSKEIVMRGTFWEDKERFVKQSASVLPRINKTTDRSSTTCFRVLSRNVQIADGRRGLVLLHKWPAVFR